MPRTHYRLNGFNLVEISIVLAVIGLVLGGVWAASSAVNQRHHLDEDQKAVVQLIANLQNVGKLLSGNGNVQMINWTTGQGTGLTINIIPPQMIINGHAQLAGQKSGHYIGIDYDDSAKNIQLTLDGVTLSSCLSLLPAIALKLKLTGTISPAGASFGPTRTVEQVMGYCADNSTIYIQIPV